LHIEWQHGSAQQIAGDQGNAQTFIRLTLTARGPIPSENKDQPSILAGLDLGRSTIVHAFRHLMSDEANRYWGLKDAH
jgi:hypothetical protein